MLRHLGVSGVDTVVEHADGADRCRVSRMEYFDDAPQAVRDMASRCLGFIADTMHVASLASVRIEMSGSEHSESLKLWDGESVTSDSHECTTFVVDDGKDVAAASVGSAAASSDSVRQHSPDDVKIMAVYEAVAEMLPVEGRDYRLNPAVKENGAVGFTPEAMTMVGKIWLDYLSDHLGDHLAEKASRVPETPAVEYPETRVADPDAVTNEQPPTGGTHDEEAEEGR